MLYNECWKCLQDLVKRVNTVAVDGNSAFFLTCPQGGRENGTRERRLQTCQAQPRLEQCAGEQIMKNVKKLTFIFTTNLLLWFVKNHHCSFQGQQDQDGAVLYRLNLYTFSELSNLQHPNDLPSDAGGNPSLQAFKKGLDSYLSEIV